MKFRIENAKVYTNFRNYLIENKRNYTIEYLPCGVVNFVVDLEPINVYETKMALKDFERKALNNICIQGLTKEEYISINRLSRA